jgi:hypothetical protein
MLDHYQKAILSEDEKRRIFEGIIHNFLASKNPSESYPTEIKAHAEELTKAKRKLAKYREIFEFQLGKIPDDLEKE